MHICSVFPNSFPFRFLKMPQCLHNNNLLSKNAISGRLRRRSGAALFFVVLLLLLLLLKFLKVSFFCLRHNMDFSDSLHGCQCLEFGGQKISTVCHGFYSAQMLLSEFKGISRVANFISCVASSQTEMQFFWCLKVNSKISAITIKLIYGGS